MTETPRYQREQEKRKPDHLVDDTSWPFVWWRIGLRTFVGVLVIVACLVWFSVAVIMAPDPAPALDPAETKPTPGNISLGTFWTINKGVIDDAEVSRMARSINEAIPSDLQLAGGVGQKVFESVDFASSTDGKRLYADDTTTGEWVSENEGNLQIWNDSATAGICIDFQAQRVFNMHCSAPPTPEDWAAAGGAL